MQASGRVRVAGDESVQETVWSADIWHSLYSTSEVLTSPSTDSL